MYRGETGVIFCRRSPYVKEPTSKKITFTPETHTMRKGIEIVFKSVECRSSLRSNKNKQNLSRQSNNLIGLGVAKVGTFPLMSF